MPLESLASDTATASHTRKPPRKLGKWLLGAAALIATTFVTVSVTNVGNAAFSFASNVFSNHGAPVIVDAVRSVRGAGDTHVLADPVTLSANDLMQLNSLNQTSPSYEAWFTDEHAVDADSTSIEAVLVGNRNHAVRVVNVRPIISCGSPLHGTLFFSPSAGADTSTQLLLNLDQPWAAPTFITQDQNGSASSGRDFFASHTISLARGEQFTLRVTASTLNHACSFTLAMDILDGNKTITEMINSNGQPFHVTALIDPSPTTPGEFSAYGSLYIGGVANVNDGTNRFGDPIWTEADPQAYAQ